MKLFYPHRLARHTRSLSVVFGTGLVIAGLTPAHAQNAADNQAGQVAGQANQTVRQVGNTVSNVGNTVANTTGNTLGQANQTVGQLGNTAGNVVNGLQPTLQPVGQGVGNALNNLTQPDNISSLLNFLAGIIPNHIEAHVNLDALRVDKVTVDIRGVDLRNLRVDLLVANSRDAGKVKPAMASAGSSTNSDAANGTGQNQNTGENNTTLPGDVPIAGSSTTGAPANGTSTTSPGTRE